jgi:hypothetical protein
MIQTKRKAKNARTKANIRVIKKEKILTKEKSITANKLLKRNTARRMMETVLTWVRDHKARKTEEAGLATERFEQVLGRSL